MWHGTLGLTCLVSHLSARLYEHPCNNEFQETTCSHNFKFDSYLFKSFNIYFQLFFSSLFIYLSVKRQKTHITLNNASKTCCRSGVWIYPKLETSSNRLQNWIPLKSLELHVRGKTELWIDSSTQQHHGSNAELEKVSQDI